MATRDDVAREAGTSSAVVSYVINKGPRNVSDATRERVLAAIAKLDYRPNAVARSLRSSSSNVIGLIVTDISNAYCGELAVAIENSALARGHTLLLGNSMHDDVRQARHIETFFAQQAKGIVFIGSTFGEENFLAATSAILKGNRAPLVFLDRSTSEFGATAVLVDNRGGARMATEHLIGHGHRAVANFGGSSGDTAVRHRTEGWHDALRGAGLDVGSQSQFESALDRVEAYAVAHAMLSGPDRPRAIFSHTDEQSIGIIHAAAHLGIRIPEDLALVSFDGIKESAIVTPALTTVQQPIARAAELAIEILLDSNVGSPAPEGSKLLPVELVIRRSCGCP